MHLPPHVVSAIMEMNRKTVIEYFSDCLETSEVLERYEDVEEIY